MDARSKDYLSKTNEIGVGVCVGLVVILEMR